MPKIAMIGGGSIIFSTTLLNDLLGDRMLGGIDIRPYGSDTIQAATG